MADAEKAVKNILDRRREFIFEPQNGEPEHYFIADPSEKEVSKADWQYSKIFNQALADGFPTQAQMVDVLKERGIISDDYTKEVEQTRIELATALFRLDNLLPDATDFDREQTAIEVAALRDKLFRLNQRVNGPLANTCENLAEDARIEFLTSRIIQKQDGIRVWKDFDTYRATDNTPLTVKSRFEVMLWLQGLESNFLEKTPEQETLRDVAKRRIDDTLKRLEDSANAQAEQEQVDAEAEAKLDAKVAAKPEDIVLEVPEVVEKKTAKKRGRPKKS